MISKRPVTVVSRRCSYRRSSWPYAKCPVGSASGGCCSFPRRRHRRRRPTRPNSSPIRSSGTPYSRSARCDQSYRRESSPLAKSTTTTARSQLPCPSADLAGRILPRASNHCYCSPLRSIPSALPLQFHRNDTPTRTPITILFHITICLFSSNFVTFASNFVIHI